MNKRGFTLIEIIVCISIIAVIGIVIGVNSDNIFGEEKTKEDIRTTVISAAEIFTDSNGGIVQPLYEDAGFIILTVGQLKNDGVLDENIKNADGTPIDDSAKVMVTRNTEGYLDFKYPIDEEELKNGYLVANNIKIAYNEEFKCEYLINEGLLFNDINGKYKKGDEIIYDNMVLVNDDLDVDSNKEYWCDKDFVKSSIPGKYDVKYIYQLEGYRKETTRTVTVLDDFKYSIDEIDNNTSKLYKENNIYYLYTKNDSFNLNINMDNTYTDGDIAGKGIQIVYKVGDTLHNYDEIYSLDSVSDTEIKIYSAKRYETYSEEPLSENYLLALTSDKLNELGSLTIKARKLGTPTINSIVYKFEKNNQNYEKNSTNLTVKDWSNKKKIFVSTDIPEKVSKKYYYSVDGTNWVEFNNGSEVSQPSKTLFIKVVDQFGNSSDEKKPYNFYVDTVPAIPTVSSGTSTTYAPTRTLSLNDLPTTNYDNQNNKYYYYTNNSNSAVSNNIVGTQFKTSILTLNTSILSNVDKLNYIYFKACNNVGCSDWSKAYNLYLSKDINDYINNNNGCTTVSGKGCFYKGSQLNNYVLLGDKKWRIYQKDSSDQLHLILDGVTDTSKTYAFSNYSINAYCNPSTCCNNGYGINTSSSYTNPYQVSAITTDLKKYKNTINSNKLIVYSFEADGTSGISKTTFSSSIGLMNYSEVSIISSCNALICGPSYLDDVKYEWGLAARNSNLPIDVKSVDVSGSGWSRYITAKKNTTLGYKYDSSTKLQSVDGAYSVKVGTTSKSNYQGHKMYLRPVVVLNTTSKFVGGDGTYNNPFIIG